MKTPTKSGGSQEDKQAGTDCQGSTDGSCRRSRHYVVISDEFRLADFLEIPGLDLEGLVVLCGRRKTGKSSLVKCFARKKSYYVI